MLRLLRDVEGYKLAARDDTFGKVKDFLFDDDHWTVRYLVADTGRWIPKRKVLISPAVLGRPEWDESVFPVNLTKQQIEDQPELGLDVVVTRGDEARWYAAYNYPYYYMPDATLAWGFGTMPESLFEAPHVYPEQKPKPLDELEKLPLHSLSQTVGFTITSGEDKIGKLDDLAMDTGTWAVRYIKVDADELESKRMLLLAPDWLESIDWSAGTMQCRIPRDKVYTSPGYHPEMTIQPDYEQQLHDHYGKPPYWFSAAGERE